MSKDIRPEPAKRLTQARLARGFSTAKDAATFFGWKYQTYIQHEDGRNGFGRRAEAYASAFRVSAGWLLTGEGEGPPLPRMPVLGHVAGALTGFNVMADHPLGYVERPVALEGVPDAYACWVTGVSMEPAFREGDLVVAHPHKRPIPGDYIIIQQAGHNGEGVIAFIKQFKREENGAIVAWQFNPPSEVTYPRKSLLSVHKVLSLAELLRG